MARIQTVAGIAICICLLLGSTHSSLAGKTIAISYFDNTSGDVEYDMLSKGISDMLITDLSKVPGIDIVEREKLEALLSEIKLGETKYFDSKTAQKLGKGLGAEDILTGAFIVLEGEMRIDARIVEVATGKILAAEAVQGSSSDFFNIHKQLVALLASALKLNYKENSTGKVPGQKVGLDAVIQYARAIDYQDKGLDENAGELLASTLQAHPGFTFASDKLDKIREWLKRAEKEREELIEKETEALLINLNADDPQMGQHINRLWTTFLTAMSYSKMLAVNKRLREQGISEDYKLYGEMSPITFGEMAGYYDFLSLYTLKRYDKALMAGKAFIESHPTSMYFSSVKMNMDLAIKELQERKSGKAAIDKAQQISQFETYANAFSRLSGFGRMDYLTPTQYKELRALYQRRILGFGEDAMKNYVANGGEYADALFEFKMAAALFLDTALMDDIAAKSKKVYSGTSLEDEAYRIAEWVESKKKTIAKHRKEADGLRTLMKSDREEDVKKMTQKIRVLVKCREWDAIVHICDAFHKLPVRDKRAYEYKALALAHLHRFDEAEQTVADYATDKDLMGDDPAGHEREVRDMKKLISEAREQALGYKLGYFTLPLYKNRAETFKNHHLYAEEASVRRQIIDRLEPDEQEGSLQLYLLVNACSNAGLFKQAREAGQELLRKYPGSSYATGLDYTLKFMPE